jgi:hypothetical protein
MSARDAPDRRLAGATFAWKDRVCRHHQSQAASWYSDPEENLTGILLTQRMMESPQPPAVFRDFWTLAYQAIDD